MLRQLVRKRIGPRKAFRANASSWSRTKPAPRLAILMQAVAITSHLMYRLMKVSSSEWLALSAPKELPEKSETSTADAMKQPSGGGKRAGARGGGGGAWRCFLHEHFSSVARRMSASGIREAAEIYRQLPQDERDRLQQRGKDALMAWRSGYASFGPRKKRGGIDAGLVEGHTDIPGLDAVAVFDLEQDNGAALTCFFAHTW